MTLALSFANLLSMEEIEVPIEKVQEEIQHHASSAHERKERWISFVAVMSALLAVLAAITALLAGHYSTEAVLEQMHASDFWSYYQSKSTKSLVLTSKMELLAELRQNPSAEQTHADQEKLAEYKKEMAEIQDHAKEAERQSQSSLGVHEVFARGVTFFQVAIGIAAVAA